MFYEEKRGFAVGCCRIRDPWSDPRLQFLLRAETRDGRAEVCFRRVPELLDQRMPIERLLDDAALHARAAAMDQAHLAKASFVGGGDVFIDNRRDVPGSEGVEVEEMFDRYAMHHVCP